MIHTALARKYRPRRFSDLVGQEHVASGLTGAVARNMVAHAYLLTGPRGVGKTTAARILAMALNCAARSADSGEPCGECESCMSIWAGNANLDVVEIDAASNRGVDDARDLRERAMYAASSAERHKVYIVDEAHMLTREAWNALLKILEEPPPRVVFVFATTEPQKIANTAAPVMSRLQRFDFRSLGPTAIQGRLRFVADAEKLEAEDAAIALLARSAEGGMRDALSALDQAVAFGAGAITAERVREALGLISDELYDELLDTVINRKSAEVFPFVARLVESGADLTEFVKGAGEVMRSLLNALLGGKAEVCRDTVERIASDTSVTAGDVLRMVRLLSEYESNIRRSANARLQVEALVLQWTLLDRTVQLDEVLEQIGGAAPPAAPRRAPGRVQKKTEVRSSPTSVSSPAEEPKEPVAEPPPAPVRDPVTLTLAEIQQNWTAILDAVAASSRMLREAMSHATPVDVSSGTIRMTVSDAGVQLDGLSRGSVQIAAAVKHITGAAMELNFVPDENGSTENEEQVARLDEAGDKKDRLNAYRAKDPTLDAAADALDLELID